MSARIVVTDEAVWVAARVYREFTETRPSHPDAVHAALEAAAPYIQVQLSGEALNEALTICDTYERMGMASASDFDRGGQRAAHDIGLALRRVLALLSPEETKMSGER